LLPRGCWVGLILEAGARGCMSWGARDYFFVAFGSSVPIHSYAFLNHEPISSVSLRRSSGTET